MVNQSLTFNHIVVFTAKTRYVRFQIEHSFSVLFLCRFSIFDAFCSMVTQVSKSLMVMVDLKDKMVIFRTKTIQRSWIKEFSKETFECWHLQHIFNQIYKSIEIMANYLKHTLYMELAFRFEEKDTGEVKKVFMLNKLIIGCFEACIWRLSLVFCRCYLILLWNSFAPDLFEPE